MSDTPASPASELPSNARLEPLSRLEKWWLRIGTAMLAAFLIAVGVDALVHGSGSSHGSHTIDPQKVSMTAPFDKPGVRQTSDGKWEAVVIAYAFGFMPKEDLVVPVDTPIHFKVTSLDVVHGYQIPGRTNVNLEVLPGHVSEVTQTFDTTGRYLVLCHEYCGSGHHFMTAHVRVVEKDEVDNPPTLDGTPDANKDAAMSEMDNMEHNA